MAAGPGDGGDVGASPAEILREAAGRASSLREMWTLMAAMPYEDVRRLALCLADLLESGAAAAEMGRTAPEKGGAGKKAGQACADPSSAATAQSGFAFAAGGAEAAVRKSAVAASGREKSAPSGEAMARQATAAPPAPRKLVLFSDGAARGNPGPSGAGAVLALPDGTIVARLGKYLGSQTNNHAEYAAAIMGLEAALKLGATEIEMIADSELMVKQVSGVYRVKNEHLKGMWTRVRELMGRFQKSSIRHVLREFNKEADEMSNRAIDERM